MPLNAHFLSEAEKHNTTRSFIYGTLWDSFPEPHSSMELYGPVSGNSSMGRFPDQIKTNPYPNPGSVKLALHVNDMKMSLLVV